MHARARGRITRWEHRYLLEAVQQRLDANLQAMRQHRQTVEHPFGTMNARMGAMHFLTKKLPKVGTLGPHQQSNTGHEHRRDQAANGCDRGLDRAVMISD